MTSKVAQLKIVNVDSKDALKKSDGNTISRKIAKESDYLFEQPEQRSSPPVHEIALTPEECLGTLQASEQIDASRPVAHLTMDAIDITRAIRRWSDQVAQHRPRVTKVWRNAANLLELMPNEQKRIHMLDIRREVDLLRNGIARYFGPIFTPAGFVTVNDAYKLVWALVEDYVNQQCGWHPEYNASCRNWLGSTPRFHQELEVFLPHYQSKAYTASPALFEQVTDRFNSDVYDRLRNAIHEQVNKIIKGPTMLVWGVMSIPTRIGTRTMGNTPVLMSGTDYRILDWNRRMGTGEWDQF